MSKKPVPIAGTCPKFIPEGVAAPPRSILDDENLQVYIRDFGQMPDDRCLVAEVGDKIVGAIWSRIMNDYGHIADDVPSIAVSLYKEYRNQGIGSALLKQMLDLLKEIVSFPCVTMVVSVRNNTRMTNLTQLKIL